MRRLFGFVILATGFACLSSSAWAQEPQSAVHVFGGLRLGSTVSTETAIGGTLVRSLTPNLQVVGEVGRISNVLPTPIDRLFGFSPVGFGVSAWYGEGGVRFTTKTSGIRPYAETSAGIARLRAGFSRGAGNVGPLANAALRLLDRTSPIATIGGGVVFERGPFTADAGYRYHRVFSDDWVQALAVGQKVDVNEVRFGVGVRF